MYKISVCVITRYPVGKSRVMFGKILIFYVSSLRHVPPQNCQSKLLLKPIFFAAVKNIKRQHLVELKALANPPVLVKLTLECVCILMGEKVSGWADIRKVIDLFVYLCLVFVLLSF